MLYDDAYTIHVDTCGDGSMLCVEYIRLSYIHGTFFMQNHVQHFCKVFDEYET